MFYVKVRFSLLVAIVCCLHFVNQAQYYNAGQDPGNLKWRMVRTKDFKLVYPEVFEPKIQLLLPSLDSIYASVNKSLFFSPTRTSVIFHPYNAESNGFTALAPKRIELYTCPPQDIYADDWLHQLMIHEFRHIVQLDQTNRGAARFFYFLFGEQALAAINGLFVPSWFMEGDAVCTETALSRSGRGRVPSFEMPLRTLVLQKGYYSYDKASMGSYKDYIPNQYYLGYHLVAGVRKRYGYTSWINTLTEVSNLTTFITPFNFGLKQATGLNKTSLYKSVMSELDSLWGIQQQQTVVTDFEQLSPDYKIYTSFNYPQFLNKDKIIALKSGMDDIAEIVEIDKDKLTNKVISPGFITSYQYSVWCNNGKSVSQEGKNQNYKIVWSELVPDKRWAQRSYSDIRIFDAIDGKTQNLTHKGRYYSPAFSPDGKTILTVQTTPENKFSLVIIDAETGMQTATVVEGSDKFLMTPSWSKTGDTIVYAQLDSSGKSFNLIQLEAGKISQLLAPTFIEINNPVFAGKYVFFNGSYSGIENVYAVEIETSKIYQVTSSSFGACNAQLSPDGKSIVYSNYSSSGYVLSRVEYNPQSWKSVAEVENHSIKLYESITNEEHALQPSVYSKSDNYKSEPYKKAKNLFAFHSWAPVYMNYLSGNSTAGVSMMSQNELSTLTTVVGFARDFYENSFKAITDFRWQGSYPIIDLQSSYGVIIHSEDSGSATIPDQNEASLGIGVSLPLVFNTGIYSNGIQVKGALGLLHRVNRGVNYVSGNENIGDFSLSLQVYRIRKQAARDIYPKFGQILTSTFLHPVFNGRYSGSLFATEIRTFFPGLFKHHSAYATFSFQQRSNQNFFGGSYIGLPRGYNSPIPNRITWLSVNYKFPFAYPDWSLNGILYCKRLKMNMFYDFSVQLPKSYKPMRSIGAELTVDTHLFRTIYPFELGFRLAYLPEKDKYVSNFLFSLNLPE